MNKSFWCSWILIAFIGGFLGAIGIKVTDWRFWVLLVAIISYGICERLTGAKE